MKFLINFVKIDDLSTNDRLQMVIKQLFVAKSVFTDLGECMVSNLKLSERKVDCFFLGNAVQIFLPKKKTPKILLSVILYPKTVYSVEKSSLSCPNTLVFIF